LGWRGRWWQEDSENCRMKTLTHPSWLLLNAIKLRWARLIAWIRKKSKCQSFVEFLKRLSLRDQNFDEKIILKWFFLKFTVTEDSELCDDYVSDTVTPDNMGGGGYQYRNIFEMSFTSTEWFHQYQNHGTKWMCT
jgi:hypothetical protein